MTRHHTQAHRQGETKERVLVDFVENFGMTLGNWPKTTDL